MNAAINAAPPGTARLFLALWPDPTVRAALRQWRDGWTWPRAATPVHPDKLHLTLHFLGNIPVVRVPELVQGLGLPLRPFELSFGQARLWPHGIAVLEPDADADPGPLLDLQASLGEALQRLAFQVEERQFRPHVTLARRANGATPPLQGPEIHWHVDRYALMESHPGAGYSVVRSYP
jgi:RNA 2',3'-cyclic 3'-phosphodiesterase